MRATRLRCDRGYPDTLHAYYFFYPYIIYNFYLVQVVNYFGLAVIVAYLYLTIQAVMTLEQIKVEVIKEIGLKGNFGYQKVGFKLLVSNYNDEQYYVHGTHNGTFLISKSHVRVLPMY